ncbi:MAG: hypothetical protein K0R57_1155 [Paenibacillaceae bacterium]|jgi:hypothetical protein|nr:hypothetical protein [Paenibacillaceae bacterium]
MRDHEEYREEKASIDGYLAQGYTIAGLREDMDGTLVLLAKGDAKPEMASLRLLNPDSRKYVAVLVYAGQLEQDAG